MVRKVFISVIWFPLSLLLLLANIKLLQSIEHTMEVQKQVSILSPLGDITAYHLAASNEETDTSKILGAQIVAGDARGQLLREFLEQYQSPMAPYADYIVEQADKNGIDFRLVVSIAMCESNLGKRIPARSYNAWGIAVYTGQNTGTNFDSWEHGIEWVSKYLKERYIDKGFTTLREIGAVYAPPSVNTGHSWSNCVDVFQKSIF